MHLRAIVRPLAIATLATCLGLAPGSSGIPNFDGNAGWIGSRPLGPRDLEGKVVLVDFWEYTCLNCLRTLPYLRAWYARYHDDGLVIVGVQTPEFAFSGDSENVEAATRRLNVAWPVVLDPSAAIWRRYANDAWPKEYLFDQDGRLVDTVAGEGRYQETEAKIQSLLKARNSNLSFPPVMALLPQDDYLKPGAVCYLDTPEVIVGHAKIVTASPVGVPVDGRVYLEGRWQQNNDSVISASASDALTMRYHAIQVAAVLANAKGVPLRVDVTQDGVPVEKGDAGSDIRYDESGTSYVTVDAPRAYDLLMNARMAFHTLRLIPQLAGASVYDFAFESCEVPAPVESPGAEH